jgi:hypothetical protein
MVDSRISDLPAVSTLADADVVAIVNAAATKKVTLNQLTQYFEARSRQNNGSGTDQTGFTSDQYIVGSSISIPQGRVQVGTKYWARIVLDKTAASGTTAPAFNIRIGTAGTTADTSRGAMTQSTQTSAIDAGVYEFQCIFSAAGASAVLRSTSQLTHQLNITGLGNQISPVRTVTSSAFDVTGAGLIMGISVNAGASNSWNIRVVDAILSNLA